MEDELNGIIPQRKLNSMKDDLNGRQPQWKTTLMEYDLKGRGSQGKNTSVEESRLQYTPYRKETTLACLASQFCTELGPAPPQLVFLFS